MKNWSACHIITIVIAAFLAALGLGLLAGGYNAIYNAVLHSIYQVTEGKEVEDLWENIPVPMVMKVYFFNITNAEDFLAGANPVLQEVGPYAYREYHHKENISYHSNMTVTFLQQRWWVWDEEASEGNHEEDVLVALNTVPVAAAFAIEDNLELLSGLNIGMKLMKENATVVTTVREFLFDGYQDPLLDFSQAVFGGDNNVVNASLPPGLLDYDNFAWFYKRNNSLTYDGVFNMYTGESSLDDVGMMDWWDYTRETRFFDYPCNMVNGSAGELWPPGLKKDFIELYSPDLCMSAKFYYQKETTDKYGNDGYRYWGSDLTFANESVLPENACFCIDDVCPPTGLLDAQTCRMGAPAFISFPHFLNADPSLLNGIVGLEPDPDLHSFYIDLIPELGVPLTVAARMQINIKVKPYPGEGLIQKGRIEILADVTEVILPILWFEVLSEMTEKLSDRLQPALFFAKSPVPFIIFSLLLVGGLCTIGGIFWIRRKRKGKDFV